VLGRERTEDTMEAGRAGRAVVASVRGREGAQGKPRLDDCSIRRVPRRLAMAFVLAALATPARATSFEPTSVERLARQSDVIAVGRVIETQVVAQGPAGLPGIHTRVELAVEEMLAGVPVSVVTFWVHGGTLGDRMRVVPGQARFSRGERVLVFLFRTPAGALFPAGMARGKWLVLEQGGRRWAAPTVPLDGGHGAALVPGVLGALPPGAVTVEELAARVRAARGGR